MLQSWGADALLIVGACSHGHGVAVQGHLQAGELALAVLQLLRQAWQVLPGAREDVQRRHPRAVQAAHHALAHLLVRRAVPAAPAHQMVILIVLYAVLVLTRRVICCQPTAAQAQHSKALLLSWQGYEGAVAGQVPHASGMGKMRWLRLIVE